MKRMILKSFSKCEICKFRNLKLYRQPYKVHNLKLIIIHFKIVFPSPKK
jgi:hypothetical protein